MSWFDQAKTFFKEIKEAKARKDDVEDTKVTKDDLEFVSSASEARLLTAPSGASFLIVVTFMLLAILLVWSIVMPVDEVVKAQGKVIPSKQVQVVQNLEGGIIKEIKVIEGQSVEKGQELIIIDDVYAQSDLKSNENSYNRLLARFVALKAGLDGKRFVKFPQELKPHIDIVSQARKQFHADWDDIITHVKELEFAIEQRNKEYQQAKNALAITKKDYELAKEELSLNKKAYKRHVIPRVEYIKSQHQLNDAKSKYQQDRSNVPQTKAALSEAMGKKESYIAQQRSRFERERNEIKQKLDDMQSKGVSLKAKVSHTKVISPVVGTVKKINFNTVGGVIRPGMDILEIIPTDDKLIIEVKVKPKDIGFILIGLKAKVKLTAFDFSTYGGLDGEVIFVSADTITDKKGISYFLVRVKTKKNYIVDKKGNHHTIIPGMQAETDIVVDKKSIMAYILKPMLK
jgi:adhesin transport system membrane fusion protein